MADMHIIEFLVIQYRENRINDDYLNGLVSLKKLTPAERDYIIKEACNAKHK